MVTRNDYGTGVFNGDIGLTLADPAAPGSLRVYFLRRRQGAQRAGHAPAQRRDGVRDDGAQIAGLGVPRTRCWCCRRRAARSSRASWSTPASRAPASVHAGHAGAERCWPRRSRAGRTGPAACGYAGAGALSSSMAADLANGNYGRRRAGCNPPDVYCARGCRAA